jgi:flavin-binding protein dodecin
MREWGTNGQDIGYRGSEGRMRDDDRFMRYRDEDYEGRMERGYGGRDYMRRWSSDGERGPRGRLGRDDDMRSLVHEAPIVKVIEVVAQSPHSWEDAARRALSEACRTIDDIKSIYVKDMTAIVSNDRIVEFRMVAKISFGIRPHERGHRAYRSRDEV